MALSDWKPELHPRDRRGRFQSKHAKISDAQRAVGRDVLAKFKPKTIGSDTAAEKYFRDNKPDLPAEHADAVNAYTGDHFFDTNKRLRAGETSSPEVKRIDAAMRPLPDDLVVTRHVQLEAFGLDSKTKSGVEDLQGRVITDAAYSSTALGSPYGFGLGGVTMHIAVPAGTPAVLASAISSNPAEREILLGRGAKLAVTRVVPNDRFGYDVFAIVIP